MTKKESYIEFLHRKIRVADKAGITVNADCLHPSTLPHERDIILWALALGRALVAPDCGLGKTHISLEVLRLLQEEFKGKCLVVTELGASETYCNEDPEVGEGARLGIKVEFVRTTEDALKSDANIVVTNYESVRMGKIDFSVFTAVWLDEGNYIKNMASETTDSLKQELKKVKYKYIASATPSPNETLELINYAHVLGIADRGQILTQFFQRNSTKAGELTLHPQHEADFWLYVHSWMVAIERPSDLGYSDKGYNLPELEIIWHEVKLNKHIEAGTEKDGQAKMFINTGNSLPDNAKIKRESIDERINAAMQDINANPDEHWIIWHHLEEERKKLSKSFDGFDSYGDIFGSQPMEIREKRIVDFTKGDLKYLATKPSMSGVGCNFQKHCSHAAVLGIDNDFNLLYQLIKRIHRFGQKHKCYIHIYYVAEEYSIVQNLKEKWQLHIDQRKWLTTLVRKHGLNYNSMVEERKRSFKIDRKEYTGKQFTLVETDSVFEWMDLPDEKFGLINTSFPFGNHYEYTSLYNDFGHNISNKEFFQQMDFLIPELLRTLQPGRICAVHLKNRIHYGSVTGMGFSIFHRFTHHVCDAMEKHGFQTMGFHYVPTDVVAENSQTYRLTFGEMQKDSTKMGAGIPEEIWLFRRPPSSTGNAYADEPVKHNMAKCTFCNHEDVPKEFVIKNSFLHYCKGCKQFLNDGELKFSEECYSLAQWQIDADSFWKSSGNRYLTPFEMKSWGLNKIFAWWKKFNSDVIYDFDQHVQLLQELDNNKKLSRSFTTLPLRSNSDFIWNDVNRMQGLNLEQSKRKERNHICPQPIDEATRIVNLYSNINDCVGEPFGGIGTTGVVSITHGRTAFLTELNSTYARCSNTYLLEAEIKKGIPTLFDEIKELHEIS